jgi:hypothetical protein
MACLYPLTLKGSQEDVKNVAPKLCYEYINMNYI